MVSANGRVALSIDGVGHSGTGNVGVLKPSAQATVIGAYLFVAVTNSATEPQIQLQGTHVGPPWAGSTIVQFQGNDFFYSYYSDVTSIVKPIVDGALQGETFLEVTESNIASETEGEILAVIFEDPNVSPDRSVSLLFGGLQTGCDSFSLQFDSPIGQESLDDPSLELDYSVSTPKLCEPLQPNFSSI